MKASEQRKKVAKQRFGGPSEKPKTPRKVTEAGKNAAKYRQGREDMMEARAIADTYDMPCNVSEFS